MTLKIKTTGLDDYIDGSANIRLLVVGGPGAGKTRMSSFWPKPIYAACEAGVGSILDRNVPYVNVNSSNDMLDFLAHLKDLERTPQCAVSTCVRSRRVQRSMSMPAHSSLRTAIAVSHGPIRWARKPFRHHSHPGATVRTPRAGQAPPFVATR